MMGSYAIIGAPSHDRQRGGMVGPNAGHRPGGRVLLGDGTTNIGAFDEASNLAAIWDLPACSWARTTSGWNTRR